MDSKGKARFGLMTFSILVFRKFNVASTQVIFRVTPTAFNLEKEKANTESSAYTSLMKSKQKS